MADSPAASPLSRRGAIALAAIALLLGLGIYFGVRGRDAAETALAEVTQETAVPTVEVVHPEGQPPDQQIVLPGNVQAFEDTPIYARASGYLKKWYVDIGTRVSQGQLIAEIETPELDQQARQARADLATAEANLAVADSNWKRNQALFKNGWVSAQARDTALGAYNAAKTTVASKQADDQRLAQMQAYEKVYAPFDGIITARNTDIGALIDAGANASARALFRLSSIKKVRVFIAVPEMDRRAVRTGAAASVTLDEFPGTVFPGKVVRNSNAIDPVSRTLNVEIDADNPDGKLLPGAYAFVHLALPDDGHAASVTVPAEALIFRKEGPRVALVRDGKAKLVAIKIGRDYGNKVEVVAGLGPEDEVILDPSDSLTDGTTVRLRSEALVRSAP